MENKSKMIEKQIREEMICSFQEWGVNESDPDHKYFMKEAMSQSIECFKRYESGRFPKNGRSVGCDTGTGATAGGGFKLPKDIADSIEFVFRTELNSPVKFQTLVKEVNGLNFYAPYHRLSFSSHYNRNITKNKTRKLKDEFCGRGSTGKTVIIDPFHRFLEQPVSLAEYWFDRWFCCDTEDTLLGLVFEAVLASYVTSLSSQISCYNCKCRSTLKWNGGVDFSWEDLKCTACHSIYEIKSKTSRDRIEKEFQYNNIRGGSYSNYWEQRLRQQALKQRSKANFPPPRMYLVIIPRIYSSYPVQIAEIDYVTPQLSYTSFLDDPNNDDIISLKSSIHVKHLSRSKWFDLPAWDNSSIDYQSILKKLYIKKFGQSKYDEFWNNKTMMMEKTQLNITTATENAAVALSTTLSSPNSVNSNDGQIKEEMLANLKIGDDECDDWENLYESEED